MSSSETNSHDGGCTCRQVRYRMKSDPMIVHCCHCRWCQRETGSAFVINAFIEADRVELLAGEVEIIDTPSESGNGQRISRCPQCQVAVWSNYSSDAIHCLRIGTLDEPDNLPPDIHIFTESKQPWVTLPSDVPVYETYYKKAEVWSADSLARFSRITL